MNHQDNLYFLNSFFPSFTVYFGHQPGTNYCMKSLDPISVLRELTECRGKKYTQANHDGFM